MFKTLSISAILLALAAIPSASADGCNDLAGAGTACTYEGGYSSGDCSNGFAYGYTDVFVYTDGAFVEVFGYGYCGGYPGVYSYEGNQVGAYSYTEATGFTYVQHYGYSSEYFGSEYSYCDTGVYNDNLGYNSLGCPAGAAPNPGWGNLLP